MYSSPLERSLTKLHLDRRRTGNTRTGKPPSSMNPRLKKLTQSLRRNHKRERTDHPHHQPQQAKVGPDTTDSVNQTTTTPKGGTESPKDHRQSPIQVNRPAWSTRSSPSSSSSSSRRRSQDIPYLEDMFNTDSFDLTLERGVCQLKDQDMFNPDSLELAKQKISTQHKASDPASSGSNAQNTRP